MIDAMKLVIPEPQRFFCEADEKHFFDWLNGIRAIRKVVGTPAGLELVIDVPIDKVSFYELVGLLTRYNLDRTCLNPLCLEHPDAWFQDRRNYWYRYVFASDDSLPSID